MSVVLDGVDQYLQINDNPTYPTPITFSAWIKTDDITTIFPVIGFDDGTADNWLLEARGTTAGDPIAAMAHTLGGSWQIADTVTGYTAGTWTHVVATFTSAVLREAFISGGSKGTDTVSVITGWVGDGYVTIGSYGVPPTTFAGGKIAEVAMWGSILSDAQIVQLAAGATPTTIDPDNIVAYWPLLSDATDSVGGFDLTAYNSPTYSADHPSAGAGVSAPADKVYSKRLVAIGNNEVWQEAAAGTMSELTAANGTINTNNPLTVAEAFQKMFVANQTNLKVADFANTKIATADLNTHAPDIGNILTGGTSGAKMVVDYITSVTADAACTIYGTRTTTATFANGETVTGTDDDSNSITFVLSAAETAPPHWYDWTPYGNDTTNFGSMPSSAYLVCRYRGRLVLSGHPNYPHQWYMAKVSNPWDWVYGSTDPLTAVAGNNVDAGEVGDIVRALIPYGDDFLIFGCADSIHILDGDPAFGGSIDELSNITGMYGPWAWCKDEDGNLYFWGSGGLYKMEGGRSKPKNISQGHLPKWVNDWAAASDSHRIVLTYDPSRNGIIISKTTLADGTNLNYWYDLKTEGFYPETYPIACGIFSSVYYDSDASGTRELILGSNDGYLRTFLDNAKNDDAGASDTSISSYLALPIIKLSEIEDSEGKLTSLTIELAGGLATTKLTHTALTTAHAKGDTLTQAISDDITVFADYGGTVTGTVKATSATHGLPTGTTTGIIISGTTNYNGTYTVTYIDANNFYFTDTWVSDDATGAWNKNTTMTVTFTDSDKLNTFGYASNGTFNTTDSVAGNGSGTAFTPTAVGTGSFSDTDGVSYELHVGDDAETVLEAIKGGATARESGTLSGAGRKNRIRKRVRGRWLGIKFYNSTASETFAINLVSGEIRPAGRIK